MQNINCGKAAKDHQIKYRRNFVLLLIDAFGWPLGMSFLSATTILPLFLRELGASNLVIGLIPAIAALASTLPQVFVANHLESMPIRKYYVVVVGIIERLPFLLAVPLVLALASDKPNITIYGFIGLWAMACLGQGINLPAYFGMMCKAVPARWRGRLYGYGGAIGGLFGMIGAWGAGLALTRFPFPQGFAMCFGFGFSVLLLTLLPLLFVDEPSSPRECDKPGTVAYLRECVALFKENSALARYTVLQVFVAFASVGAAFYTVYSLRNLGATTAQVAVFNGLGLAISTAVNPLGGIMADKFGHNAVMKWSICAGMFSAIAAILAPAIWGMYIAFALYSLALVGYGISTTMLLLDFAPENRVPTYTAISGTLSSPFRFFAPILAGWIADNAGYSPVFLLSILMSIIAIFIIMKGLTANKLA